MRRLTHHSNRFYLALEKLWICSSKKSPACRNLAMPAIEGALRIKRLGRYILWFGSAAMLLLWLVAALGNRGRVEAFREVLAFVLLPVAAGGAIWTVGWILEGFFRP
jgi:hypothetical protein